MPGKDAQQTAVDQTGSLSDVVLPSPPRLSTALFRARTGASDPFRTTLEKEIIAAQKPPAEGQSPPPDPTVTLKSADTFDAELKKLLGHVEERLKMGLGEAWWSDWGYGYDPFGSRIFKAVTYSPLAEACAALYRLGHPDETFEDDPEVIARKNRLELFNKPEEKWARALCEVFSFLMYGGPMPIYAIPRIEVGNTQKKVVPGDDVSYTDFYSAFAGDSPVYPLAIACEHQATYAVLALGHSVDEVSISATNQIGFGCNGRSATSSAFKKGIWCSVKGSLDVPPVSAEDRLKGKKGESQIPVTTEQIRARTKPGDALFFNFRGPESGDQKPGAKGQSIHVGTVLRIWGDRLQYFDTGSLYNVGDAGDVDGGTTDHNWADPSLDIYDHTVGVGICGELPGNLADLADKLVGARPLGFARLVVFDETVEPRELYGGGATTARARYISRPLHLWLENAGVHLSRLMWSVREPPTKGIRLAWWVYLTKGVWARKLLDPSAVNQPIGSLYTKGGGDELYPCNLVLGTKDGGVTIYRRFARVDKADGSDENKNKTGWKRDFGTEENPSGRDIPWVSIATAGQNRKKAKQNTAVSYASWADNLRMFQGVLDKAYVLRDPTDMAGDEITGEVGVPFFDQNVSTAPPTQTSGGQGAPQSTTSAPSTTPGPSDPGNAP